MKQDSSAKIYDNLLNFYFINLSSLRAVLWSVSLVWNSNVFLWMNSVMARPSVMIYPTIRDGAHRYVCLALLLKQRKNMTNIQKNEPIYISATIHLIHTKSYMLLG